MCARVRRRQRGVQGPLQDLVPGEGEETDETENSEEERWAPGATVGSYDLDQPNVRTTG